MNEETKIEKGIPIPVAGAGRPRSSILRQLEIGDSFVCLKAKRIGFHVQAAKVGIKIVTRKVSPTEIRVWRFK